jgi:hypothetical protein
MMQAHEALETAEQNATAAASTIDVREQRVIDGVKIILPDPGFPQSLQVIARVGEGDVDLAHLMLVQWPIDIHVDENGAYATLHVRVKELELNGVAIRAVDDENEV